MKNNVKTAVRNTVESRLGIVLSPEDEFVDIFALGADSLDVIQIFMDLEVRFNVSIPDEKIDALEVMSVDNITHLVGLYV